MSVLRGKASAAHPVAGFSEGGVMMCACDCLSCAVMCVVMIHISM